MSLVARTRRFDSLDLPVKMSSQRYTFVGSSPSLRIFPPESILNNWADEFEDLDAIFFIADLAIYSTYSTNDSLWDDWNSTLHRFRRVCNFAWLAEKEIVLVLMNNDKLSNKRLNIHASGSKQEGNISKTIDDIIKRFVSLNDSPSRKIHVILADNDDRAKNLESLDGAVKQILSKKANWARDS